MLCIADILYVYAEGQMKKVFCQKSFVPQGLPAPPSVCKGKPKFADETMFPRGYDLT